MLVYLFDFIYILNIFYLINCNVETLHFESGCLKESNQIELHLRCSLYEHIEILRVIYGYSKQRSNFQCQFSIYDCIQEGASRNILSCNGKQTCLINLTKNEILTTTVKTQENVPSCKDFNYVQVNFGCIPDAKDICDSWKEESSVIHISHTRSRDKKYDQCQCKIRSSLIDGQVLLHAREMNRQFAGSKDIQPRKTSNTDCKKTTYLEIATDRSERKCMDNLPSGGNALFGSGSHNFTLSYVRNDPFSELFFYFELKASPNNKDHHVQIICNWERRTTTIRTTLPMTRKRKLSTLSMVRGGKQSRLDLIRHPSISENDIKNLDIDEDTNESLMNIDETTFVMDNEHKTVEEETLTTENILKSEDKKTTSIVTNSISFDNEDDDEWSRIISEANIESPSSVSKQLLSTNNRTLLSSIQASILFPEEKSSHKISKNKLIIMLVLVVSITIFLFLLYCLKVKQPRFIQRIRLNLNVALLFCSEAGKLLFSSSNNPQTLSTTPSDTIKHHQSLPLPIVDYQSSEYYMNHTAINCRTAQSIYDDDDVGKSIYTIDNDDDDDDDDEREGSEYMSQYDRCYEGDTC